MTNMVQTSMRTVIGGGAPLKSAIHMNKIKWFDPLGAVKHSKGDSMDY